MKSIIHCWVRLILKRRCCRGNRHMMEIKIVHMFFAAITESAAHILHSIQLKILHCYFSHSLSYVAFRRAIFSQHLENHQHERGMGIRIHLYLSQLLRTSSRNDDFIE